MEAFTKHTGIAAPLPRADIDTDAIIPKQFLKRIERTGYGPYLFWEWRAEPDGTPIPDFVLNREPFKNATILIARENFGCGSSREHAAWALHDFGIRAAIELPSDVIEELLVRAEREAPLELTVDLAAQTVSDANGVVARFEIDPFRKKCLLEGLDRIGLTLKDSDAIAAYERKRWPDLARAG
jgi:3-isopropylmalate/(R)-2-methylmalate dehydratase small subunit